MSFTCFWMSKKLLQQNFFLLCTRICYCNGKNFVHCTRICYCSEKIFVHCTRICYCTVQTFFQCSNVISLHIQDAGYKSSTTARFSSRPGGYKGSIDRKKLFFKRQVVKTAAIVIKTYYSIIVSFFMYSE